MEEALFNLSVGVTCGLFIGWVIFKIRHGSMRQYSLLMLKQAEEQASAAGHTKTVDLMRQEQLLSEEKQRLSLVEERLKKEAERHSCVHAEEKALDARQKTIAEKEQKLCSTLERISALSLAEARAELLHKAESSARQEIERTLSKLSRSFEEEQESKAQKLLLTILERKTLGLTRDSFLEEIPLPDQTFVPRFIGKEGRNIKTLSSELDLNIVIEENPPRILLSSYDPYRRALAKAAILALIVSEKITPHTIHNAIHEQATLFPTLLENEGALVCKSLSITTPLAADILRCIGTMKYRSTAGQNLLQHSIDVAELMAMAACELGLHVEKARVMGLLHDVGKVLPPSEGLSHAHAGKNLLQRHHIHSDIINGVAAHHGEESQTTNEAKLLPICDRLSAQLYGTRIVQDDHRLLMARQCEEISLQEEGVFAAWAHHASSHIELVIQHSPQANLSNLQYALENHCSPLPVVIRSINATRKAWDSVLEAVARKQM